MMKKILVLPGDGIGPEVCEAVLPLFNQLALPIELEMGEIGWECWKRAGNPVPEKTWQQIAQSDAILLGAITSQGKAQAEAALPVELQGQDIQYVSPVIQLRQRLDLFANVRPAQHLTGNRKPFRCCVIRENTEGLYVGADRRGVPEFIQELLHHPNLERSGPEQATFSIRLQTRFGLERLFQYAFEYASTQGYSRVTLADKPNVLRESGQFAADIFYSIATRYPSIRADIHNVDALALWVVRRPEEFGVIVAENMFGDILSDLAAGVMGGLGVAPSANVGNRICYFEPVHGSAPGMAGQDRANPSAMFLSVALALRHLGFMSQATRIEQAVRSVIVKGRHVTYDLGGQAGTRVMAQAILDEVMNPQISRQASVLCIGDELLRGQNSNSNAQEFGRRLDQAQYAVNLQLVCGDQPASIRNALEICLGHSDVVVISGGLGPTSDDVTREAIASATGLPLQLDEASWQAIQSRLKGFGLEVSSSNRRQAVFPQGAEIIPNLNGTAPGFTVHIHGRTVHVLPGPPRECLPMLDALLAKEKKEDLAAPKEIYHWRLLGVIESDVAQTVDEYLATFRQHIDVTYLCRYPYIDIRIAIPSESKPALTTKMADLEILLKDHLVSKEERTALDQIGECLTKYQLCLEDALTQGAFTERLTSKFTQQPETHNASNLPIKVSARTENSLQAPFQGSAILHCSVELGMQRDDYTMQIPRRGPEIVDYACEFIAWSILRAHKKTEA